MKELLILCALFGMLWTAKQLRRAVQSRQDFKRRSEMHYVILDAASRPVAKPEIWYALLPECKALDASAPPWFPPHLFRNLVRGYIKQAQRN